MKLFLKSDYGIALLIAVGWKILLISIGFAFDALQGGASNLIDHTMRWDTGWYVTIINDAYQTNPTSAAFYPLFPLLVSIIDFITFGALGLPLSGQIVNLVAIWFVIAALIKLAKILLNKEKRFWLVALVLCAPAAFFLHVFYGEALFLALSLWAYLFALKRNWLGVGILLALLTASRLPSLLIVALCGLEYLRAYGWSVPKAVNKNALFFLLAPIGFILFATYLYLTTGDFLGMFKAYKATNEWSYQVFNPNVIETIAKAGYQLARAAFGLREFDNSFIVNSAIPFLSIVALGASSLYLLIKRRGKYIPLGITGLLAIIMFTLNSNVVSVHRYVLPMMAIAVAIALVLSGKHKNLLLSLICTTGFAIQVYLYWLFIGGTFAG